MFVRRSTYCELCDKYECLLSAYRRQQETLEKLEEENENLRDNYDQLFHDARNLKDKYAKVVRERDQADDRIRALIAEHDHFSQWIGEFAVRHAPGLRALMEDVESIRFGWQEADGVYPWDL